MKFFNKNSIFIFIAIFALLLSGFKTASAATTIYSANRYAWNDVIGWIDFYVYDNVVVTSSEITGYASSSVGAIGLNCNSTPNGDTCSAHNWKVSNDGSGTLSGWAWNDNIGWISFNCSNVVSACDTSNYSVTVDGDGYFNGWAWNDAVGWISFNKANCDADANGYTDVGACGGDNSTTVAYDYKVRTTPSVSTTASLISSVFDTGAANGVNFSAIIYQGTKPSGTNVRFQFASSNSDSGPWTYMGTDGSASTYYAPSGPDIPELFIYAQHANKRYFRYKIFLESDQTQTITPTVTDVTVIWNK